MKTETKKRAKAVRKSPAKRTPLSAKSAGGTDLLKIATRIGKLADEAEPTMSWRDKVKSILAGPLGEDEGIIRAAQIMREAGAIDGEESCFFIVFGSEIIADRRIMADAELNRISAEIRKKEKKYGLKEDEYWPAGEAPDDVETLRAAFDKRRGHILADVLREFGEDEMVDLYLRNEKEFYRRLIRGSLRVHADDDEKVQKAKGIYRELLIKRGWEDLLPGLDM